MISWLLARLRNIRYSIQNRSFNNLFFGGIYKIAGYRNYKQDPSPLIFVMYSGPMQFVKVNGNYTDGININYLNYADKVWLTRIIYILKKGGQKVDGRLFYKMLKIQRPNIIRTAYRRYHTNLLIRPRLVSAGLTVLYKLVYPLNDPYIQQLNEIIQPTELAYPNIQIAYSPTELRDRIMEAQNTQNIKNLTVADQSISIGTNLAPWAKKV